MPVGTNIKKRRFEMKMTQEELAKALGYKTRSTIAKIESGENNISLGKLEEFARILDTTVDSLIDRPIASLIMATERRQGQRNIAVILAGGKSTRNQKNIPNQFINVAGKPIIIYSMEVYQRHPAIDEIYAVCLNGWEEILSSYATQYGISKLNGIFPAGETGMLSVKNAVMGINADSNDIVIFQESTRPLTSEEIISKVIASCKEKGNAVTCEHMNDHLQFVNAEEVRYINRNLIIDAQTPEAYHFGDIKKVIEEAEKNNRPFSESIAYMFMHNNGIKLNFIEGDHYNIKIIRQEDIAIFSALLKRII